MSQNFEKLLTDLSARRADLILLILASQNIENHVERENNSFNILVNHADMEKALIMIETYYKENKFFRLKQQLQEIPISSFKSYTAFSIMGLLWLVHALCLHTHIHEDMILKYGASALFILQGETYRAVTALFLHSDARHLVGNMAGMLIFGAPVITLSGFGVGPFMLLFAGTIGNLINAHLYKTAHLSIGASTAIMGAAGLLVAFQITQKAKPFRLNNLMPIFAGAVLIAMFSQGENTDVWAHVFGFFSGLASGVILFPLNRMLQFTQKDPIALLITILIIASSILSAT
ncbi:MAG: rhomboid family intramembrane serine protease [Desulfobacula sp.]|uniref:rhomboid family intramembrane serine protease n=1 Tax=Desulfobacula sp. TaxID=2593537 RepID=UPI0025C6A41A|nr:rhomboid family intramembrane serine protease [Desulfobacula sp.]MCD4720374.1 rhomboid family intramembrane serine protease [Desulfobacula sp.]